jgi:tripartite-type tricarboxylate transporter receptor subunit TctC
MEFFMHQAGISLVHIAYKGAGGVASALFSGEVQASFVAVPAVLPHIKSGKLKGLAVKGIKRVAALPDLPTMVELGFPEFQVDSWQGIYVPAGTPAPVVAKLRAAIIKVVDDQRVLDTLRNGGAEVMNKAALEECANFTRQQVKFWARLVKQVGLAGKQ